MRYRLLATFQGAPYEAGVGPDDADVVLFAACPPPEDLKFEPATGHWRKQVSRTEVQTLYESRPIGMFRGERCIVLDDLTDRLHIVYLGHDAIRAAQLGYWEVDRGVFELITPRNEVTDIVEQRLPLTDRDDSGPHSRPMPRISIPDGGDLSSRSQPSDFDQRSRADGYGGYEPDSALTGPSRSGRSNRAPRTDPNILGSPDQSSISIPAVDEPPLPLEAQALRAATTAARRGQKGQSRQSADTRSGRRAHAASGDQLNPSQPDPTGQSVQSGQSGQSGQHALPGGPIQSAPYPAPSAPNAPMVPSQSGPYSQSG